MTPRSARAGFLLPPFLLLVLACSGGGAPAIQQCETSCTEAPAAECLEGAVLRTYEPEGTCTPEGCSHDYHDKECAHGCADGACIGSVTPPGPGVGNACEGTTCQEAPPSRCRDADVLEVFLTPGRCEAGRCAYTAQAVACPKGCAGNACLDSPCTGKVCDRPPEKRCLDAQTLRSYQSPGSCADGNCAYAPSDTTCAFGCEAASCKGDPCAGVSCAQPPAAFCVDTTTLKTFSTPGTCAGGACTYASQVRTCAFGCEGGACRGDPCSGVSCSTPPANHCADATTLRAFNPSGTCSGGGCAYGSSEVTCAFGCAGAKCKNDPCAGVSCKNPPATYCADPNTLRAFASSGSCSGGSCTYSPVDSTCGFGCANGKCQSDPCVGVSCTAPPKDVCAGPNTARHFATAGTCGAGACSYPSVDEPCPNGCVGGQCQANSCKGVSCNAPPVSTCINTSTLRYFFANGTCDSVNGTCAYQSVDTTCSQGCLNGNCLPGSIQTQQFPNLGGASANLGMSRIAIDSSNVVHIAACADGKVLYRRIDSAGWKDEEIEAGLDKRCQLALAIGANGQPAIAYLDTVQEDLRYAERTPAGFQKAVITSQGATGYAPGLLFGSDGEPRIVYFERNGLAGGTVRLARRTAGAWTFETVLTGSLEGGAASTSSRFDPSGKLHLVIGSRMLPYSTTGNAALPEVRYLWQTNNGWSSALVTDSGGISHRALAFGPGGEPTVLYGGVRPLSVTTWDSVRSVRFTALGKTEEIVHWVSTTGTPSARLLRHPMAFDDGRGWSSALIPHNPLLRRQPQGTWQADSEPYFEKVMIDDHVLGQDGRVRLLIGSHVALLPVCAPTCAGRNCGNDGCGGTCGTCSVDSVCGLAGNCGPWETETVAPVEESSFSTPALAANGSTLAAVVGAAAYDTLDTYLRSGGNWSPAPALKPALSRFRGTGGLALDGAGNPIIGYDNSTSTHGYAGVLSLSSTAGWTPTAFPNVTRQVDEAPAVVMDKSGHWHAVFSTGVYVAGAMSAGEVWYSRQSPTGPPTSELVSAAKPGTVLGGARGLNVAIDAAGKAHVLWMRDEPNVTPYSLRYSSNESGSWAELEVAKNVPHANYLQPRLAVAGADVFAQYVLASDTKTLLLAKKSGAAWVLEPMPSGVKMLPGLASTPAGELIAIGTNAAQSILTVHTRKATGSWVASPPLTLAGTVKNVLVVVDGSGKSHLLYDDGRVAARAWRMAHLK